MEILHRCMRFAMQFVLFFIPTRRIHKTSQEKQIDCVQECIKLITPAEMDLNSDFSFMATAVLRYGRQITHDSKELTYDFYDGNHEAFRDRIYFVVTCVLHRALRWSNSDAKEMSKYH